MSVSLKCQAFVLKKRQLLNNDLVVDLFTDSLGKVKVFAHGIRKITSRRGPHMETGNLIAVVINRKGERHSLSETKLISGFSLIKDDKRKLQVLYLFLFVLERVLPEGQAEESLFNLFKQFLVALSKEKDPHNLVVRYLNGILKILGYQEVDLDDPQLILYIEDLINEKLDRFNI